MQGARAVVLFLAVLGTGCRDRAAAGPPPGPAGGRLELAPMPAAVAPPVARISDAAARAVARQGVAVMGELADVVGGGKSCAELAEVLTAFAASHRDGVVALRALGEQLTDAQKQAIETEFDKPMTDRVARIVEALTPCQGDRATAAAMDALDL